MTIAYDGTDYHGWQRQQQDIITIQEVVEKAIGFAIGRAVTIRGSGRTDAGVHAAGQVANFFTDTPIPERRLHQVINRYLPWDIRVLRAEPVGDDFNAIASATSKLYRYSVYNYPTIPIPLVKYNYHFYPPCDIAVMQEAAGVLVGEHDFSSFSSGCEARQSNVRKLLRCQVSKEYHQIYFDLEGTGFLYHMVRNIVGTLLEIGRGHWPIDKMKEILESADRRQAGPMAPAQGLSLQWVRYE